MVIYGIEALQKAHLQSKEIYNRIGEAKRLPNREIPLILLAAGLWLPGMRDGYFLSDDFVHLVDWCLPPLAEIWQWFYREYAGFYRPLTALLWKAEYLLWGLAPFGYQLTNLLLHVACSLLVRDIARRIFAERPRAGFWAGMLFLFLPGHIFGLTMISALTGLLCSLFYLAAASLYLRDRDGQSGCAALSLAAFMLALLTKELAISLPLVIGAWEATQLHAQSVFSWRRWLRVSAPYAFVGGCYVLGRYIFFGHLPHSPLHDNSDPLRILVNATAYGAQMLSPWGVEGLKPLLRGQPIAILLIGGTGLVLSGFLLWRFRHTLHVGHVFCLLWIGISLSPVVRLYSPWNTYLPSAGAALLLAGMLAGPASPAQRRPSRLRHIALAAFLGLSVLYSLRHHQQWRDARMLCREVVEAIAQEQARRGATLYLANLPAEWDSIPLLVGDWALREALRIKGITTRVVVLGNVIQSERREKIAVRVTAPGTVVLELASQQAFFRLETVEIVSRQQRPAIGYAYGKDDIHIAVTGLNSHGQANSLAIDLIDPAKMAHVVIWDGSALVPLVVE